MSLPPPSSSLAPNDWEDDDMEYTTVPPPASSEIERCRVDEVLDQPHQALFLRAIRNILHTRAAEFTFAQLVDGLPLWKVGAATVGAQFHSAVREHETLCPGAMDKAKSFRDDFDPAGLDLPINVLQRYQDIPAGSRASKLPFVELIAVAIHRIAVLVYKQGGSLHEESKLQVGEDRLCHNGANESSRTYYPTPFSLYEYANPEYPDGVADIAGYWAENWIFGGVVVFSRGESGVELINNVGCHKKCNDVWLHSFREYTTDKVWALTEDQLARLLSFLESHQETVEDCPLPIVLRNANMRRMDADNCIPEHNIYRDRWERKMRYPTRDEFYFGLRGKDVDDEIRDESSDGVFPDLY